MTAQVARPEQHIPRYTLADYVDTEARSPTVKHEFVDGQIVAMAGGTPEHAALAAAVTRLLTLPPGCRAYSSDLRVRVPVANRVFYPDVTVVCGRLERDQDDPLAICNPTVIVEVTSRNTEEYDRGEKFEYYACVPSLRAYVLVGHATPSLEIRARPHPGEPWTTTVAGAGEEVVLAALEATLAVDAIYRSVQEDLGD